MNKDETQYFSTIYGWCCLAVLLVVSLLDAVTYWRCWYNDNQILGGILAGNCAGLIIGFIFFANWCATKHQLKNYCANCGKQK